jgi:cellulose biosynthesis protein BcsQ
VSGGRSTKNSLVDMDPQGNATSGLGVDKATIQASSYELLTGGATAQEAIQPTFIELLDVVPATIDLVGRNWNSLTCRNDPIAWNWPFNPFFPNTNMF